MKTPFTTTFHEFWKARAKENWGGWPDGSTYPEAPGGIGYMAVQEAIGKRVRTRLKFYRPILTEFGPRRNFSVSQKHGVESMKD